MVHVYQVSTDLHVGDQVYIQNLVGNHPRRWECTGTAVEVKQFHQYVVNIDGSGRLTLRNRQHLRRFTPFNTETQDLESLPPATPAEQSNRPRQVLHPTASPSNMPESTNDGTSPPPCNSSPEAVCPPISTTIEELMPSQPNSPETSTEPPPSSTP